MCKIITHSELYYRSLAELQSLHRKVLQDLALAAPGTEARRYARISLENINYAIARKRYPLLHL